MSEANDPAPARRIGRRWLPLDRRGLIIAGIAIAGAGAALNWGWLTAVGAAPLLLALAPCALMCALGLCMKGGGNACDAKADPAATPGRQEE
ncbi:hypothetical protein [Palleronia rufa]|uniref:hypothetical protein n=1 Tax=Palleronia rufa TaxID=1530186 RepID=UPI00055B0E0A|nr:hypothetical protein [Palleronia rufa]